MEKLINIDNLPEKPYKPLAEISRRVSAEGCVLLKNEGNVLPLSKDDRISLFGRTQIDYNKSGTGSGGLVRVEYRVNILDGIRNNPDLTLNEELAEVYKNWILENPFDSGTGWAQEPWCQKEMVLEESVVVSSREKSDVAVIVIGRTAGEDRDNKIEKGSWYLTDEEEGLLSLVTKHFDKTVVLLNTGNIIDMSWTKKYDVNSVIYVWQGGQEGGNAVADVLSGYVTPSGKLTNTIPYDINTYPGIKDFGSEKFNLYKEDIYVGYRYYETFDKEAVMYPFGFGLSYTEFERKLIGCSKNDDIITLDMEITNIGDFTGRDVIEVYAESPQGLLGKSARALCGFKKTKLLAIGESQTLTVEIPINSLASYDDGGVTGNKSCYVLEKGEYNLYAGACVRSAEKVFSFSLDETVVTKKCTELLAPVREFDVIHPVYKDGKYEVSYKPVSMRTVDYDKRIKDNLPKEITPTGDKGILLDDVKQGKATMEAFVAELSDTELISLTMGEGMCSPKVRPGGQGAVGGLTESLAKKGVAIATFHDGPSGIRIDSGEHATSLPNGTAIACAWDEELAEEIYSLLSVELYTHKIDSILGPGINLHRVPLNGRNFEYLSEDPFVTGKISAALIRGVGKYGNSATVKHFAVNSQEYYRREVDSVVSERALREIYLKCFEYAICEGKTTSVMTSYNPINGIWSPNNYELNTELLRNEWGYGGFVMTDWWPKLAENEEEPINLRDMVVAQNDTYMVVKDVLTHNNNLKDAFENGEITRGQLQRNAMNVLSYVMNSHSHERFVKNGGNFDKSLVENIDSLESVGEILNPISGEEIEVTLKDGGRQLLKIEYSSDEPTISQMTIYISINGTSAVSVTVNGTLGEKNVIYHDVSLRGADIKAMVTYPDKMVNIKKIEFFQ